MLPYFSKLFPSLLYFFNWTASPCFYSSHISNFQYFNDFITDHFIISLYSNLHKTCLISPTNNRVIAMFSTLRQIGFFFFLITWLMKKNSCRYFIKFLIDSYFSCFCFPAFQLKPESSTDPFSGPWWHGCHRSVTIESIYSNREMSQ